MSKKRYFIGRKIDGTIEAFSTTECNDPETKIDLPALAQKLGYLRVNGEFSSLESALRQISKKAGV